VLEVPAATPVLLGDPGAQEPELPGAVPELAIDVVLSVPRLEPRDGLGGQEVPDQHAQGVEPVVGPRRSLGR
jgi:hypothetical protein